MNPGDHQIFIALYVKQVAWLEREKVAALKTAASDFYWYRQSRAERVHRHAKRIRKSARVSEVQA